MKSVFQLELALAAVLVLASCATTEPYPDDWSSPRVVEEGRCPDISGTFSNACTPEDTHQGDCLETGGLAGLLFGKYAGSFHVKLGSADRVVISQPSSLQLLAQAWRGNELVREGEIRLDPDDCTGEGVWIKTGLKGTQIEGGIGTGSSRAVLNTNEDGDLITKLRIKFTGVWFIVPVSGSSEGWIRFLRLDDSGAGEP